MPILTAILITLQALGASIGAVASVWSEFAYMRALQDKNIDAAERAHLKHIARGLRFGLALLLLASLGLVILAFRAHTSVQPGLQSAYWVEMLLVVLIITLSWLLSKRKILFTLGSAALFSAWWFLALLALGQMPVLTIGAAIALYLVSTAILFGILSYARMLMLSKVSL